MGSESPWALAESILLPRRDGCEEGDFWLGSLEMTALAKQSSSIAIWERVIQPSRKSLDEPAAKALLGFRLSKRDLDRADMLANKAASGDLSAAEAV